MPHPDLLSDCLVDSDAEAASRARKRRRKALMISVAVELALLGALLLTPILMPGTMSARYVVMPIPPYGGGGHRPSQMPTSAGPHQVLRDNRFQSPSPRPGVRPMPDSGDVNDAPSIGGSGFDSVEGDGNGPPAPGIFEGLGSAPPPAPAERPAAPRKPLIVDHGAQEAKLIHRVQPDYPTLAPQIHLSGTVELRAIIAKDGSVINLEVISGNPILARSALDAVKQWRYRPTLLNGEPVEVQTFVTVNFVLQ
jgi:periplasmic protein TonB